MSDQPQKFSADDAGKALDRAGDYARENPEQARDLIDKVEDVVDERTGGRFSGVVDKAGEWVENQLGLPEEAPPEPGSAPDPAPQEPTRPSEPAPAPDGPARPGDPGPADQVPSPAPEEPQPQTEPAREEGAEPGAAGTSDTAASETGTAGTAASEPDTGGVTPLDDGRG